MLAPNHLSGSPANPPEKLAEGFVSEKKPLIPVIVSVLGVAVGETVMMPEALMPPPLNAKVNESAIAVCVVRVPANPSKANKIQRDGACAAIALPAVRHTSTDEGVFSQNEIFTCFSLKLLRMIDRGLD